MNDFVVYHNPDRMGYSASEVDGLSIVTNRRIGDVTGSRVWLITGEGKPRAYSLCGYFTVDSVKKSSHPEFGTEVAGSQGKLFDPMKPLDTEAWFDDFKRSQGNFAFGFQAIKDIRFIKGLLRVAAKP